MANQYTVQSGDTLSQLALNNKTTVANLQSLNPAITNPNKIQVGQLLNLPGASSSSSTTSKVTPTDTSNAGNINNNSGLNLPSTSINTPTTNDVNGLISFYKSQYDTAEKQATDAKAAADAAKSKQTSETAPYQTAINNAQIPSVVAANATAQTGVNPTQYFADEKAAIAELDSLNTDYNKAIAGRDAQIAAVTGQPGQSLDFMNNQIAQINRNAAPLLNEMSANINAKAATFQANQQRFQEAQTFVQKAVDSATATLKFNVDMFNEFYDINQKQIDQLTTQQQTALADAKTAATSAWTTAVNEKTQVGQLMINPSYQNAGIAITDSLDQAYAKIAKAGVSPDWTLPYKDTMTGDLVQRNNKTGEVKVLDKTNTIGNNGISGGTYVPGQNLTVDSWVNNIRNGTSKIGDVPKELKNAVAVGMASVGGSSDQMASIVQQTKDALTTIDPSTASGFNHAIGSNIFFGYGKNIPGTNSATYLANLDKFKSILTLPNLNLLKGMGRVTATEFATLQNSLTSLNPNMSESAFKTEYDRIKKIVDALPSSTPSDSTGSVSKQINYQGKLYNVDASGNMTPAQ